VNKWGINAAMAERIEQKARKANARIAGRIRHECNLTVAQMEGRVVVKTGAAEAEHVRRVWGQLNLRRRKRNLPFRPNKATGRRITRNSRIFSRVSGTCGTRS
jgi:hypothetical protein